MDDFTKIYFDGIAGFTSDTEFALEIPVHRFTGRDEEEHLIEQRAVVRLSQTQLSSLFGVQQMAALRAIFNGAFNQ